MRPIQRYGATPEGLQRYLYSVSNKGKLTLHPRMEAMCFGATLPRFFMWLDELERTGLVVDETTSANVRLRRYRVTRPEGWVDDEPLDAGEPEPAAEGEPESTGPVEDFEYSIHSHPRKRGRNVELNEHTHAWGSTPHAHLLRALCSREECIGCESHNTHQGPQEEE